MLRKWIKKYIGQTDYKIVDSNINLRQEVEELKKEVSGLKGQVKVDKTEALHLKEKLQRIRDLIGRDDECFSKWTRKQIEEMSISEFVAIESEIDQDIIDGKIFLR